ncbi:SIMPL domain-containing protein [Thermoleptolyngbya sp.]
MKPAMPSMVKGAMKPNKLTRTAFGLSSSVLLALGGLSLMPMNPEPVMANEVMTRVLTVMGTGNEFIPTTLSQVNLGVEVRGATAEAAQQEAARRSNAVVQLLRSRQVDKLQTTGINLTPVYNYNNNEQRLVGYTATNNVSFRVPTEQAGGLLDEAVKAGASRIDSVSFVASDEAIAQAQQVALREAVQQAQSQADTVLAALGLRRQEIVGVQINYASAPPPMPILRQSMAMDAAAAPTPVIGGEQEVQTTVTLQIRY